MLIRLTVTALALGIAIPAAAQTAPDSKPAAKQELDLALYDLDTPIGTLIEHPKPRAVLDKYLPGLSTDENLDKFRTKSLREFQPYTGGRLTDALLAEVGKDLRAIH